MADFANIKTVFGRTDYSLRSAIAQTLKNNGEDLFPRKASLDDPNPNQSGYLGKADQNVTLDRLSVPKLQSIKNDVLKCDKHYAACIDQGAKKK